jgi:hypothetical protein
MRIEVLKHIGMLIQIGKETLPEGGLASCFPCFDAVEELRKGSVVHFALDNDVGTNRMRMIAP